MAVKFSIRDSLFAVAIIAVVLGWWLDHNRLTKVNDKLNAENADLFHRVMPQSGFGYVTPLEQSGNRVFLNSNSDDRQEILRRLDHSMTSGNGNGQHEPSTDGTND